MKSVNYHIIFFGVILGIFMLIIKSKIEYYKAKSKIMNENISAIASNKEFISCIIQYIRKNPNISNILNSYIPFEIFRYRCLEQLKEDFKNDYKNNIEFLPDTTIKNPVAYLDIFPYFKTLELKLEVFTKAIESLSIEKELLQLYSYHIENNIKELEKEENNIIIFNKTFNDNYEKNNLPLHPAEKDKNNYEDIEYPEEIDFNKLISMEVVEEFDDNLKEF